MGLLWNWDEAGIAGIPWKLRKTWNCGNPQILVLFGDSLLPMDMNELKKQSAVEAVKQIKSGDVVGLGTGSTAYFAVEEVGRLLKEGILKDIVGVATSIETDTHVRYCIVCL